MDKPEIVTLRASNFRQASATLRTIADQIDAGEFGGEPTIALVLCGNTLEVMACGPHAEPDYAACLLSAGHMRLIRTLERHGRGDAQPD